MNGKRFPAFVRRLLLPAAALVVAALLGQPALSQKAPQVKVVVEEVKTEVTEPVLPVQHEVRINPSYTGGMAYGLTGEGGKRLTFSSGSARTLFSIDGQIMYPNVPGGQPLPEGPRGRKRHGVTSTFRHGDVVITQTMEIVPGKRGEKVPAGTKRFLDTLLIRYVIENKGNQARKVGVRMRMDTYNVNNDGCLFASPLKPNQILNGGVLKDKDLPPYLMSLQIPNVQNPGNIAYFTFKLGNKSEPPTRVQPTAHGVGEQGFEVQAVQINGDSDMVLYWDPKEIKPGGKREVAYAYGEGIASNPENEGRVTLALGGSFVPGKTFTVTAYVDDPVESQSLALDLPEGMDFLEGRAIQPVPPASDDGRSIVFWKGRVQRPGQYALRVRSSNGVTHTRSVTITDAAPGKGE